MDNFQIPRRDFIATVAAGLAAGLTWPFVAQGQSPSSHPFHIRTITAGIPLEGATDFASFDAALAFLKAARQDFQAEGYEVQTIRMASQPLAGYLPDWASPVGLQSLGALDRRVIEADVGFSIGPVLTGDKHDPNFAGWAVELVRTTQSFSFSAQVASPETGVHHGTVLSAAEAVAAIAAATPGGEGNFRFAATAFCPPGTPFFPAAWHAGKPAFSLGLETPPLLLAAFEGNKGMAAAQDALRRSMNAALAPIAALGAEIEGRTGWRYLGIDVSPAPGLKASIGEAIEKLTGAPFGAPSTLAACAAITEVLKSLDVQTCGYSGLMLPILEDPVLARRAVEGRYGVSELLLYSSVCGTGLDVIPLPGDTPVEALAATITDVAALATRYQKPLSARLFPLPGKAQGEVVRFDNPYLTEGVVMSLG